MLVIVLDGGDSKQMTIQYNTMTIQLRSNTQLYSYLHIHNAAARFVTGARRHDHMTPVLREWHWLPARQRKRFKTAVMVYKCIHGLAPSYLASHCKPTSSALVGPICDPPRLANSTFLARRLTMGSEVSLSMDQLSGTAYLLNFGHLTSRRTFSKPSWRHFCLTADLAHLVYLF